MFKLKLHTAIILAAMSVAASCTNYLDDTQGSSTSLDNAIEVNAMIGNNSDGLTRAATSSEATTATLTKFWMSAFKAATDTVKGTDSSKASLKLFDREFTRTDGVYADGGTYYWSSGSIYFCAIATTDGAGIAHPSGTDTIKVAYESITATDFKVERSDSLAKFENQEDYIVAVNKTAKPAGTNKIDLTFQHLLSRISINAYAPDFKTKHPSIACFAFDSVQVQGTFTYTGTSTSNTFETSCWSTAATGQIDTVGSVSNVWYENNVFQIDTLAPADGVAKRLAKGANTVPWLNVIPGSKVSKNLYITFWYQDKQWKDTLSLKDLTGLTEYKPGYQYIYNVKVKGSDDAEGEKVRPEVELVNITVQEWGSQAASSTIETPDVANGNTLKEQIEAAQNAGKTNLEVQLTSTVVTEVTMRDSVKITTNVVIDLNNHTLIPSADTSAFFVTGGHRLAIKGTGTVKVDTIKAGDNDKFKTLADSAKDSFAIRGGTWSFDPQRLVPGFSEVQTYTALSAEVTTCSITITGPSYKYTVTRSGSGTTNDPYSYTVGESALN